MRDSGFIGKIEETKDGGPVLKFRFGVPNAVKPLEGNEYKPLYKDAVIWPGTPAAATVERLAKAGYALGPGASVVIDYEEKGKEWKTQDDKVRVDVYLDVFALRLQSSGSKKESSDREQKSAPEATPAEAPTHLGAGGVAVSDLM